MASDATKCPVVFLMGPTASGKTALAIELYQTGRFEIVSVDSAMVFRDMNIGSAKPSAQELALAPHHLIDFIDPADAYSASQFATDARKLIGQIQQRGKVPLLVGGTMLYFKALKDGLAELPASDPQVRQDLKQKVDAYGIESLHQQLCQVDAEAGARLSPGDTQRVMRAMEVFLISGKPLSQWHQEQALQALPNPVLNLALAPADRAQLHQRIEQRFEIMMQQGFLQEVESLYQRRDLNLDLPSMRCVGYRQLWQYLDGDYASLEEAVERAVIATRQLAKRQYTWLRSWPNCHWFDPLDKTQQQQAHQAVMDFSGHPSGV